MRRWKKLLDTCVSSFHTNFPSYIQKQRRVHPSHEWLLSVLLCMGVQGVSRSWMKNQQIINLVKISNVNGIWKSFDNLYQSMRHLSQHIPTIIKKKPSWTNRQLCPKWAMHRKQLSQKNFSNKSTLTSRRLRHSDHEWYFFFILKFASWEKLSYFLIANFSLVSIDVASKTDPYVPSPNCRVKR